MTDGGPTGPSLDDVEIEIAWMYFIEGLTQAEIAQRRGLSKVKVHRLLQSAQNKGLVQVFINAVPRNCIEAETRLMAAYRLEAASIVPATQPQGDMHAGMTAIGRAGARFLHAKLEPTEERVIGIGSGRTIAEVVRHLPPISRPRTTFVSATGDFAALSEANPLEVLNALIRATGGSGYALTAPLIVDTPEDRAVMMRQSVVRKPLAVAARAELFVVGIGHVGPNSFFDSYELVSEADRAELVEAGVVADLVGHLLDREGRIVDCGLARRFVAVDRALLAERPVFAVAGGWEKREAILAALRSGLLDGLITTHDIATYCLDAARPARA